MKGRRVRDAGSVSLELTLLTPVLLSLALLLVAAGHLPRARLQVDAAAQDAARAATLASSTTAAGEAALAAVHDSLDREQVSCARLDVDVDLSRFTPGGNVTVTVRCRVDLSWLHLPVRLPTLMVGTASVPVDAYQSEPGP